MPLLSRIAAGVGTLGVSEAVRAVDKDAGRILEAGANAVNPASWFAHGVFALVQACDGELCAAAGTAFRAIPFNPVPVGGEVAKLFARDAQEEDYVGTRTLFHITSVENAKKIKKSRRMKVGSEGILGAAIYAAESERSCLKKARMETSGRYGLIKMKVNLGHCKQVSESHAKFRLVCDGGMSSKAAQSRGFQSASCNFNGGQMYGVFHSAHVEVLEVKIRGRNRSRKPLQAS